MSPFISYSHDEWTRGAAAAARHAARLHPAVGSRQLAGHLMRCNQMQAVCRSFERGSGFQLESSKLIDIVPYAA